MYHVALTGNIASGKSSVAALLTDWGAVLIDADAIVRRLQRPGTEVFRAIVARFGPGAVTSEGVLDRPALRARILSNPEEKRALEANRPRPPRRPAPSTQTTANPPPPAFRVPGKREIGDDPLGALPAINSGAF